eukprot:Anaeramoba_ignava/c17127_g1_i3.p1 GENE.c17127_g1_i3~~c17127_g1_i3.p1  ORF type:complete len:115 (-),score=23.37 c17127_g1_i3:15-359(-)
MLSIESQVSKVLSLGEKTMKYGDDEKEEEQELPPDILLQTVTRFQTKSSCYCNCLFKLKTKLAIHTPKGTTKSKEGENRGQEKSKEGETKKKRREEKGENKKNGNGQRKDKPRY